MSKELFEIDLSAVNNFVTARGTLAKIKVANNTPNLESAYEAFELIKEQMKQLLYAWGDWLGDLSCDNLEGDGESDLYHNYSFDGKKAEYYPEGSEDWEEGFFVKISDLTAFEIASLIWFVYTNIDDANLDENSQEKNAIISDLQKIFQIYRHQRTFIGDDVVFWTLGTSETSNPIVFDELPESEISEIKNCLDNGETFGELEYKYFDEDHSKEITYKGNWLIF